MNPFEYLLLAHLLLDYPFQGDFLATIKGKNNFLLVTHCLLWTLGICAVLDHYALYFAWSFWWLFLGHVAMDYVKSRGILGNWLIKIWQLDPKRTNYPLLLNDPLGLPLWIDQLWHVFQVGAALYFGVMQALSP